MLHVPTSSREVWPEDALPVLRDLPCQGDKRSQQEHQLQLRQGSAAQREPRGDCQVCDLAIMNADMSDSIAVQGQYPPGHAADAAATV